MLEIVIKLVLKLCLSHTDFDALQCLSAVYWLKFMTPTQTVRGMEAVTNTIWRAGAGIVFFPLLWVVVGKLSFNFQKFFSLAWC